MLRIGKDPVGSVSLFLMAGLDWLGGLAKTEGCTAWLYSYNHVKRARYAFHWIRTWSTYGCHVRASGVLHTCYVHVAG